MRKTTKPSLTETKMKQVEQSLEIYKRLVPIWKRLRTNGSDKDKKRFLSLNRNPLFDMTGVSYFKTGLMSNECKRNLKDCDCKKTHDHLIQRTKALEYVFNEISSNSDMTPRQYVRVIRRYCSTVLLTREEHNLVTSFTKNNPSYTNASIYSSLGIKIPGLDKWVRKNKIVKVSQRQY
jgi:hypothetical protein